MYGYGLRGCYYDNLKLFFRFPHLMDVKAKRVHVTRS